jgi:hypothetical protein
VAGRLQTLGFGEVRLALTRFCYGEQLRPRIAQRRFCFFLRISLADSRNAPAQHFYIAAHGIAVQPDKIRRRKISLQVQ